jgi:four helix bundle protein
MASSYQDLRVWQQSMDLTTAVYAMSLSFPKAEQFGLTSQMRRAAVSIPSNIAEGKGRNGDKEFRLFLFHARGSLLELETQILIAGRLGYIDGNGQQEVLERCKAVGRALAGLINSLSVRP